MGEELRAFVRTDEQRRAVNADQTTEHLHQTMGANGVGYIDRQALPRVLVDHRQALDLLVFCRGVEDDVVGHAALVLKGL